MPADCLFDNVEISDPQVLAEHAWQTPPTIHAHGARYLLIGSDVEVKEGSDRGRTAQAAAPRSQPLKRLLRRRAPRAPENHRPRPGPHVGRLSRSPREGRIP
jgi:uncharacterized protein (DUF1330 family)